MLLWPTGDEKNSAFILSYHISYYWRDFEMAVGSQAFILSPHYYSEFLSSPRQGLGYWPEEKVEIKTTPAQYYGQKLPYTLINDFLAWNYLYFNWETHVKVLNFFWKNFAWVVKNSIWQLGSKVHQTTYFWHKYLKPVLRLT